MNYAQAGFILAAITVLLFGLSVANQLGFIDSGEIYVETPYGQVAVGAAVAYALNDGGLELLDNMDFPRATSKDIEIWGMEVNGHRTYIATDWKHHTAHTTMVDYSG